jgi:hypothetical protein
MAGAPFSFGGLGTGHDSTGCDCLFDLRFPHFFPMTGRAEVKAAGNASDHKSESRDAYKHRRERHDAGRVA